MGPSGGGLGFAPIVDGLVLPSAKFSGANTNDTAILTGMTSAGPAAREVKVALSGLFGRFVARAYLERYFNPSMFAHLGSQTIDLDRRRKVEVTRIYEEIFWIGLPARRICRRSPSLKPRDATTPEAPQKLSLERGLKPAASDARLSSDHFSKGRHKPSPVQRLVGSASIPSC